MPPGSCSSPPLVGSSQSCVWCLRCSRGSPPLHTERLLARGRPGIGVEDPLIFYDTSSNGPQAISLMERLVGSEQLLYGSDRPVVDPDCHGIREALDWERLASDARARLFAHRAARGGALARPRAVAGAPAAADRASTTTPDGAPSIRRHARQRAVRGSPAQARGRARKGSSMSGGPSYVRLPRGHNLCGAELETFVGDLANSPELWIDLVKHDQTQRHYEEIFSNEYVTAWLICWMEDHDTGFHDHDISCGAVSVVSGCVREERLALDGSSSDKIGTGRRELLASSSPHRTSTACATPAATRR